jgi:hypothetical protein
MRRQNVRALALAAASALVGACGSTTVSQEVYEHAIAVKYDGEPIALRVEPGEDGASPVPEAEDYEFEEHLEVIVDRARGHDRLLLYVHGGMKPIGESLGDAQDILDEMGRSPPGAHPILVNWESSMGAAYWDHLARVRQGKQRDWWVTVPSFPFYVIADAGRAITRAPIVWGLQAYELVQNVRRGVANRHEKVVDPPDDVPVHA